MSEQNREKQKRPEKVKKREQPRLARAEMLLRKPGVVLAHLETQFRKSRPVNQEGAQLTVSMETGKGRKTWFK